MENVKQELFDSLVEEFSIKPSFILARTLFLFCHFNSAFEVPGNVKQTFVDGLLKDEVRAFGLRYRTKSDTVVPSQKKESDSATNSLDEMKKDIYKEIAAEDLSKGTGKTYTPSMVDKINTKFKGVMSYNDILEIFLLKGLRGNE